MRQTSFSLRSYLSNVHCVGLDLTEKVFAVESQKKLPALSNIATLTGLQISNFLQPARNFYFAAFERGAK